MQLRLAFVLSSLIACSRSSPSPVETTQAPAPPPRKAQKFDWHHQCTAISEADAERVLGHRVVMREPQSDGSPQCVMHPPRGTAGIYASVAVMPLLPTTKDSLPPPPPQAGSTPVDGLDGATQFGNNHMLSIMYVRDDWMIGVILQRTDGLGEDGTDTGTRMPSRESLTVPGKELAQVVLANLPPVAEVLAIINR